MKEKKNNSITDNQKLVNLINTYFKNITDTLQLKKPPLKFQSPSEIISFYENHDRISKIKKKDYHSKNNLFQIGIIQWSQKFIKSLNRKEFAISSCISVSFLIDLMNIYLLLLTDIINDSLKSGIFPDELKLGEVIPLFKKADPFDKTNYRTVSLLLKE